MRQNGSKKFSGQLLHLPQLSSAHLFLSTCLLVVFELNLSLHARDLLITSHNSNLLPQICCGDAPHCSWLIKCCLHCRSLKMNSAMNHSMSSPVVSLAHIFCMDTCSVRNHNSPLLAIYKMHPSLLSVQAL